MVRILFIVVSVLLCLSCKFQKSESELDNIYGKEDRIVKDPFDKTLRAIGKLSHMHCTGTLVYRDLVLTAAHCVIDSKTKRLHNNIAYFQPNYRQGVTPIKIPIDKVWWGTAEPDEYRSDDWAILKLREMIGDSYGYIPADGTTLKSFPNTITHVGYATNFKDGETPGIHYNCATKKRNDLTNLIFIDCDSGRGASGGPLLRVVNGQMKIVGLYVAEHRDGGEESLYRPRYEDDYANIAIPLKDAVAKINELIRNDP